MSNCGQISANVLIDCDNPMIGGANDRLVILNKDDWDAATITRDGANNQLITDIVLATGADAYNFEGKNHSVEPSQTLVKQRYAEVYDHQVDFKVFGANAAVKAQLENLVKGNFVAIIQNNYKGASGSACFEVYGEEVGMEIQELARIISDAETQGAFSIVMKTPEEVKEGHLPATLFDTSFAATKAVVDALIAA